MQWVVLRTATRGTRAGSDPRGGRASGDEVVVAELDPGQAAGLGRDPAVRMIVPVMPTHLVEDSPGSAAAADAVAWGISAVGADTSPYSGAGVDAAVLDTGICGEHPAFEGIELTQKDFTTSVAGAEARDRNGHGTRCASIAFGRDVGGRRIGVARGVTRLHVGKVLGDDGRGSSGPLFKALSWAIEEGCDVISVSIHFDFAALVTRMTGEGLPMKPAVAHALVAYRANLRMFDAIMGVNAAAIDHGTGAVVVAAAGNDSSSPEYEVPAGLPAAANDVIAVGSVGRGLDVSRFSNVHPTLCAPGENISCAGLSGGLASSSGTSMAAPHVAGIAALWYERARRRNAFARVSPKSVVSEMLASADPDRMPRAAPHARGLGLARAPGR